MSYTSPITAIPQILRQPIGIAVLASLGVHGLLWAALPRLHAFSKPEADKQQRTVGLVELTPAEQSRLPQAATPQVSLPPFAMQPSVLPPNVLPPLPPPLPSGLLNPPNFSIPPGITFHNYPPITIPPAALGTSPPLKRKQPNIPKQRSDRQKPSTPNSSPTKPTTSGKSAPSSSPSTPFSSGGLPRTDNLDAGNPKDAVNSGTPQPTPSPTSSSPSSTLQEQRDEQLNALSQWQQEIQKKYPNAVPQGLKREKLPASERQFKGVVYLGVVSLDGGVLETESLGQTGNPDVGKAKEYVKSQIPAQKTGKPAYYLVAITFS